jgi:hypothetical protein
MYVCMYMYVCMSVCLYLSMEVFYVCLSVCMYVMEVDVYCSESHNQILCISVLMYVCTFAWQETRWCWSCPPTTSLAAG